MSHIVTIAASSTAAPQTPIIYRQEALSLPTPPQSPLSRYSDGVEARTPSLTDGSTAGTTLLSDLHGLQEPTTWQNLKSWLYRACCCGFKQVDEADG